MLACSRDNANIIYCLHHLSLPCSRANIFKLAQRQSIAWGWCERHSFCMLNKCKNGSDDVAARQVIGSTMTHECMTSHPIVLATFKCQKYQFHRGSRRRVRSLVSAGFIVWTPTFGHAANRAKNNGILLLHPPIFCARLPSRLRRGSSLSQPALVEKLIWTGCQAISAMLSRVQRRVHIGWGLPNRRMAMSAVKHHHWRWHRC